MFTWSGYNWLLSERWGEIHLDKPYCWYDPSCVDVDKEGFLHLKTHYNPKYYPNSHITSNVGVGLVSCTEKFYHGTYEIEAKLPIGKNLWPAFWMWSWDSWPPEIDIFEAYSGGSNYFNLGFFNLWKIETNVHYKKDGNNSSSGAKSHWFGFKNPTKNFIKYKLDWQEKYLGFYYNDSLVRLITDSYIMDQLNQTTMNVIINNHVTNKIDINNPPVSDFVVKYFKYTK